MRETMIAVERCGNQDEGTSPLSPSLSPPTASTRFLFQIQRCLERCSELN